MGVYYESLFNHLWELDLVSHTQLQWLACLQTHKDLPDSYIAYLMEEGD